MRFFVMVQGSQRDYDAMRGTASPGLPAWSRDDVEAMFAFMGAVNDELTASGELVDAQGLTDPAQARAVILGPDGEPVVTDAPYSAGEVLMAGYWVLDCAGLDRVTEIATRVTRCPVPDGSPPRAVVVRPIGDGSEI
ncbi:YciI family protein [Kitasatospora sp. NPDC088346]|uniref:YciI family protein n=1 Tax=Kitasatospora sp. NPDC088346 TaxID=3364073 RepID=UPI003822CE19